MHSVKLQTHNSMKNIPFRTGSRMSLRAPTSRETPRGAVNIHSCVLSGRASEIWVISCKE